MGVALSSHFEKPKGFSVWLATIVQCLRHFFSCNKTYNQTTTAFPSLATRHKICHPFGVPLMDVCLAGVPCFALHRLPVFFHAFGIILFKMPTALMSKIPTKTCRGKVMKEKLNCVKTTSSLFIHHSSFRESLAFTAPNISFDRTKGHVSPHQTLPFTRRNMVFRAAKPYLWQIHYL